MMTWIFSLSMFNEILLTGLRYPQIYTPLIIKHPDGDSCYILQSTFFEVREEQADIQQKHF